MIKRIIESPIDSLLGSGKAIIIMGARQVGKSTLLETIFRDKKDVLWMTGDDLDVQELFSQMTSTRLKALLGKTKTLIELVNNAANTSNGSVVCIEKGTNLRYDIKPTARLIDVDEYMVDDAQSLYGFVAGILASNHDVTDLFIDSALKICKNDLAGFDTFVADLDALVEKVGVNVVITSSIPAEEASETVKKYL